MLLNNQESCVINGGHTTKYFKLKRGARQGDPISAYLFILALEIFFIIIKTNKNIHGLEIFDHEYLYTAYTDDTTFFLEDISSIKVVLKDLLHSFSGFSGLRPNFTKCEIAGIGVLKSVNVALWGMKCLDLTKECIKVLGVHISYNRKLQGDKNFCDMVKNISNIIKLWRMRHLSLGSISKIVYLALLIPNSVLEELKQIQKTFLWRNKRAKIKHDTLCNHFTEGGLKSVDIKHKFSALRCSWIQRLYNEKLSRVEANPSEIYSCKAFGKYFKFHSNLYISFDLICTFPIFYQNIITSWCNIALNNFFNTFVKIEYRVVYYKEFLDNQINNVCNFFDRNKLCV